MLRRFSRNRTVSASGATKPVKPPSSAFMFRKVARSSVNSYDGAKGAWEG